MNTKDLLSVYKKTNGRCFYCNGQDDLEVDHFISKQKWREWDLEDTPIAGELNNLENLFLSCMSCNRKKSDSCPEDFIGNSYIAWKRYTKANNRINRCIGVDYNNNF